MRRHRGPRHDVYWAGRATLVRRPEDIELYDRAFAVFWDARRRRRHATRSSRRCCEITLAVDDGRTRPTTSPRSADRRRSDDRRCASAPPRCCGTRTSPTTPTTSCVEAQQLMSRLAVRRAAAPVAAPAPPPRARTGAPDLRRTVRGRHACRRRADAAPLPRADDPRRRRLVLLLDVSGSMEPYARALLRFVQAAVAGRQRVEAFALGTRLHAAHPRARRARSRRRPRQAAARVVDWAAAPASATASQAFNDEWGDPRHGARRDRRDPVRRVGPRRPCRARRADGSACTASPTRWSGSTRSRSRPGYAPLARGMAAALPHVDAFVEGHSLDAMERLAQEINTP